MENEANELLDPLFTKIDKGEFLEDYEQGVKDAIDWIYNNGMKPEIEE